jgi:hypothetical protein
LIDKLSAFESLKYKKEENLKEAREEWSWDQLGFYWNRHFSFKFFNKKAFKFCSKCYC